MTGWAQWQENEAAGHTDPKDMEQKMSLVSAHILVFYAVQNSSLWDGTAHIQDGSSLLTQTSLETPHKHTPSLPG